MNSLDFDCPARPREEKLEERFGFLLRIWFWFWIGLSCLDEKEVGTVCSTLLRSALALISILSFLCITLVGVFVALVPFITLIRNAVSSYTTDTPSSAIPPSPRLLDPLTQYKRERKRYRGNQKLNL